MSRVKCLTSQTLYTTSVRGLVVMIVACQVMDPGSIPGERIFCQQRFGVFLLPRPSPGFFWSCCWPQKKPLPLLSCFFGSGTSP